MTDDEANARSSAIDAFTQRLVQVRADAGDPSFRAMAKRSGAISHATMHDAVQGVRLPSWETTVEFARACGVDPETLRAEWEQADAIVHPPEPNAEAVDASDDPEGEVAPTPDGAGSPAPGGPGDPARATPAAVDATPVPGEGRPRPTEVPAPASESSAPGRGIGPKVLVGVGVLLVVALVAGLGVRQLTDDPAAGAAGSSTSASSTGSASSTAADGSGYPPIAKDLIGTKAGPKGCPVNADHQRPQRPARLKGDGAKYAGDGGFADCSPQKAGAHLVKQIKLTNTGVHDWVGRKLVHIEPNKTNPDCSIPRESVIPTIRAGQTGTVEIDVSAPERPGICFARFMQLDRDRQWAFPDQRPYFLSLKVE